MGLSGSQARLLYLTAQMNNLSLKGQNVSDAKTRLAMDTQAVQEKYIKALNNSHLYLNTTIYAGDGTGAATQKDFITVENLEAAGYRISDGSKILGYKWQQIDTGETEWLPNGEYEDEAKTKPVYVEVPKYEYELVADEEFSISSIALEEGLRSGALTLVKESKEETTKTIKLNGKNFNTVDLSSCSVITDEVDQSAVAIAEAEYNKDMAELQQKDKRFDMDQKKIDTQYQAYLHEEESIKTVLGKNVERSFKTFG